ncbi:hypothetical protein F5880DRAFT_1617687 [Lentinula raphanica]|nr:hypothetical protein F5880DRAFT_1617687 [Lentinula raphanica]
MRFALTPYLLLAVSAVVYARPLTRTDFNEWNVVDPVSHLDPWSPPVPGTGTPPPRERVVTLPQIMVTPPPSVTLVITFTGEAANGVTAGIPSSEDTPLHCMQGLISSRNIWETYRKQARKFERIRSRTYWKTYPKLM